MQQRQLKERHLTLKRLEPIKFPFMIGFPRSDTAGMKARSSRRIVTLYTRKTSWLRSRLLRKLYVTSMKMHCTEALKKMIS